MGLFSNKILGLITSSESSFEVQQLSKVMIRTDLLARNSIPNRIGRASGCFSDWVEGRDYF